jgi:hypothetical protein
MYLQHPDLIVLESHGVMVCIHLGRILRPQNYGSARQRYDRYN